VVDLEENFSPLSLGNDDTTIIIRISEHLVARQSQCVCLLDIEKAIKARPVPSFIWRCPVSLDIGGKCFELAGRPDSKFVFLVLVSKATRIGSETQGVVRFVPFRTFPEMPGPESVLGLLSSGKLIGR
jgi:hypothetical protein